MNVNIYVLPWSNIFNVRYTFRRNKIPVQYLHVKYVYVEYFSWSAKRRLTDLEGKGANHDDVVLRASYPAWNSPRSLHHELPLRKIASPMWVRELHSCRDRRSAINFERSQILKCFLLRKYRKFLNFSIFVLDDISAFYFWMKYHYYHLFLFIN